MQRSLLLSVLVLPAALAAAVSGADAAPDRAWGAPSCASVQGLASVSFTSDDGATYAGGTTFLPVGQATFGIATLETANVMLAEYRGAIYRSTDAGCRWRDYAAVDVSPLRLVAGTGEEAWGWSLFQGPQVYQIDAKSGPRGRVTRLPDLPANVLALRALPGVPGAVRAVGDDGSLYEWRGGGGRWTALGAPARVGALTYFADIDPANPDHAVIGEATNGVWTTLDAGATWANATGLSATNGPRNAFNGLIAPADGRVVWVMSLDLDESDAGAPSGGRHVYRSEDGGLSFAPVVDQGNGITLTNGPAMASPPSDANVVYFPFGSKSFEPFGIRLFRYDHATGLTTWNTNSTRFEIRSLAFNPGDPSVVYAGFEGE